MHQRHVISLLIHGFLSVNARLLIAFGTAFYAITSIRNPLARTGHQSHEAGPKRVKLLHAESNYKL